MRIPEKPRRRADLIFREIDGDFVVYDPVTDHTLLLNVASAAVLELCDGDRTLDEMTGEVAAAFEIGAGQVREDVEAALRDFARRQLFESA